MCQAAAKTVSAVMVGIRPTLVSILTATGLVNTTNGVAALAAFDALQTSLQNWVSGTAAQEIIQALTDFNVLFQALPIPAEFQLFENIIVAGIVTVIGIVTANSPVPAPPAGVVAHEESVAMYQASVAADTAAKVQSLVPSFKRSFWHSPEAQYKKAWNDAVKQYPNLGVNAV